jgi:integron integrase
MPQSPQSSPAPKARLADQLRDALRRRHYSYRTEQAYLHWMRRFVFFHNKRHPLEMAEPEVAAFLTHLAVERRVSASTQNQALNALLFLYKQVLGRDIGLIQGVTRAKRSERLPVVLTHEEVQSVLGRLAGREWLMACLMYGAGLRVTECLRLRVKDIDFGLNQIVVRDGKGQKDRVTPLPAVVVPALREQLREVMRVRAGDLADGYGEVSLPFALARKYPNAARELPWWYVFPASARCRDPYSGGMKRHHLDDSVIQRAVRQAVRAAGIMKPVSCHTLRHCFATHLLAAGYDIRTIQELLGHQDVRTTMIYTHVLGKGARGVASPLDAWAGTGANRLPDIGVREMVAAWDGNVSEAANGPSLARGPRLDPIGEAANGPSLARGPRLDPIGEAARSPAGIVP